MTYLLALALFQGVPSAYTLGEGQTELDPVPPSIDLLSQSSTFALESNAGAPDYQVQIAALKNGGIRGDSPLVDSNLILAAAAGSVTETFTLAAKDPTPSAINTYISNLERWGRYAWGLNATTYQNKPIYLQRWAIGELAPAYALVIDISYAVQLSADGVYRLTLSIEREPGWRALPPGANPKLYAFQSRGEQPNVDYDYTGLFLNTAGDHYLEASITNHCRRSGTGITADDFNYVDIPAEMIPGDMPALLEVFVNGAATYNNLGLYVARKVRPFMDANTNDLADICHNGGDSDISGAAPTNVTRAYTVLGSGVVCDPPGASGLNTYVLRITYATGAITDNQVICQWDRSLDKNLSRARCFVRARLNSGTVTNAQFQVGLGYAVSGGATYVEVDEGNVFDLSANPSPGTVAIFDAGVFDLTFARNPPVTLTGVGASPDFQYRLTLKTVTRGVVGTNTVVDLVDIILLPIDEYAVYMPSSSSLEAQAVLDNTGYLSRASDLPFAGFESDPGTNTVPVQAGAFTGQVPVLEPGVDNRLYFLFGQTTSSPAGDTAGGDIEIYLNIVPRWRFNRNDQVTA